MTDLKNQIADLQAKAVAGTITEQEAATLAKLTKPVVIVADENPPVVEPVTPPITETASTLSLADKILYSKLGIAALEGQPLVSFDIIKACCGLIFGAANFEQIVLTNQETGEVTATEFYKLYIDAKKTHIIAHQDVLSCGPVIKASPMFRIKVESKISKKGNPYTSVMIVKNRASSGKAITV